MFTEEKFVAMQNNNVDGFGDFGRSWRKRIRNIVKAPLKVTKTVVKAVAKPVAKVVKPITKVTKMVSQKLVKPVLKTALKPVAKSPIIGKFIAPIISKPKQLAQPVGLKSAIASGPVKEYDVETGQYWDSTTGNLFDPNTGEFYDPYVLGKYYEPKSKMYYDTNTGEPIQKAVQDLWQTLPPDTPQSVVQAVTQQAQEQEPLYSRSQWENIFQSEPRVESGAPIQWGRTIQEPVYEEEDFYQQPVYQQPVIDRYQESWYPESKIQQMQPWYSEPQQTQPFDERFMPELPDFSQWSSMPSMESSPMQTEYYMDESPMYDASYEPSAMPEYSDPYENNWWFSGLGAEDVPWYMKAASTAKGAVSAVRNIKGQATELRKDVKDILPKKKQETIMAPVFTSGQPTSPLLIYGLGAVAIAGGAYLLLRKR